MNNDKAFKLGKIYSMTSPCDQTCVWTYKVTGRTAKTVTLEPVDNGYFNKTRKCRISTDNRGEFCRPLGRYSMSPVLTA